MRNILMILCSLLTKMLLYLICKTTIRLTLVCLSALRIVLCIESIIV
nr:MAG TPA: hypothetical protein [Caudoviricetes sp.]